MEIISQVVGGLALFLLGMKNMSEGMQAVAGTRLRKMIAVATDNRFLACGTGAMVTSVIQSSSVTTVMLVGFVNAGIMTLTQAIGVMLGADIGTTITGWIVSLQIGKYGLPVLAVSAFFFLFTKNERVRYWAMALMGVGMVFFGLQLMKHGIMPLRESDEFVLWFSKFVPDSYIGVLKCVAVGALVTAVVQSSSATVAITMTLAGTEVIGFDTAVALVLGQNIGTTITAYLASLGASTNAKRVAYAHVLTKVIGGALAVAFFFVYVDLLRRLVPDSVDINKRIAFAHTLFNVFLVVLFLPLRDPLTRLLQRIYPEKTAKETPHLTFLDVRMLDTPAFGIQQSYDELLRMRDGVGKMMIWLKAGISDRERDDEREKHLFHREEVLDVMQKEILEFLSSLLAGSVPQDVMTQARKQLRIADEYESISDYIVAIMKLDLRRRTSDLKMSEEGLSQIMDLHQYVSDYIEMLGQAVEEDNSDILSKAVSQGETITHMAKLYREQHLSRVESKAVSPLASLIFTDMLSSYRKIKDHALNIAETLSGIK